ncbi:MAG: hypothetical protein RMZ42_27435 [Nostoc sp. DedQUE05]|nr:hypothetical protein [Nostoc sp. DedQUE05]MDZ8095646.1 hypothetical protein [Nostoc sp. DedQUE05]
MAYPFPGKMTLIHQSHQKIRRNINGLDYTTAIATQLMKSVVG